ncbi:twin-arginine translocase subunit TatC [Bacillus sp. SCS-151]|uniref:twin-arginine translocase subunit TatC n=1 Tax=Nanhaiella sioensis TaxID=3115293 RepID=UPI00397A0534
MEDQEMKLVDHLDELRKRLLITMVAFIIFFILAFIFVKDIYNWLVMGLDPYSITLVILGPSEVLWVYFTIAGILAIACTIPILALQIWLFVKPALKPMERKITLSYIPALFILFILGLCFGYFVILDVVFGFLTNLGEEMFDTMFTAEKYFQFVLTMTIPFAILFELPVVVMFLTSIGIINPYVLQKVRKYAYFVLVIISVTISPPDFISDFLVTIPLLFLYECSIILSKIVYKKKQKKEERDQVDMLSNEVAK